MLKRLPFEPLWDAWQALCIPTSL